MFCAKAFYFISVKIEVKTFYIAYWRPFTALSGSCLDKNLEMENNFFLISIQVSQGLAHFEVWDCGGPGIGMCCLRHSDMWQEVVIVRESPLEGEQHGPEPAAFSAFRFTVPPRVPHPSLEPGGVKQAGWADVGVGSLLRGVVKYRACSQHLWEISQVATFGSLLKCALKVKGFLANTSETK